MPSEEKQFQKGLQKYKRKCKDLTFKTFRRGQFYLGRRPRKKTVKDQKFKRIRSKRPKNKNKEQSVWDNHWVKSPKAKSKTTRLNRVQGRRAKSLFESILLSGTFSSCTKSNTSTSSVDHQDLFPTSIKSTCPSVSLTGLTPPERPTPTTGTSTNHNQQPPNASVGGNEPSLTVQSQPTTVPQMPSAPLQETAVPAATPANVQTDQNSVTVAPAAQPSLPTSASEQTTSVERNKSSSNASTSPPKVGSTTSQTSQLEPTPSDSQAGLTSQPSPPTEASTNGPNTSVEENKVTSSASISSTNFGSTTSLTSQPDAISSSVQFESVSQTGLTPPIQPSPPTGTSANEQNTSVEGNKSSSNASKSLPKVGPSTSQTSQLAASPSVSQTGLIPPSQPSPPTGESTNHNQQPTNASMGGNEPSSTVQSHPTTVPQMPSAPLQETTLPSTAAIPVNVQADQNSVTVPPAPTANQVANPTMANPSNPNQANPEQVEGSATPPPPPFVPPKGH